MLVCRDMQITGVPSPLTCEILNDSCTGLIMEYFSGNLGILQVKLLSSRLMISISSSQQKLIINKLDFR